MGLRSLRGCSGYQGEGILLAGGGPAGCSVCTLLTATSITHHRGYRCPSGDPNLKVRMMPTERANSFESTSSTLDHDVVVSNRHGFILAAQLHESRSHFVDASTRLTAIFARFHINTRRNTSNKRQILFPISRFCFIPGGGKSKHHSLRAVTSKARKGISVNLGGRQRACRSIRRQRPRQRSSARNRTPSCPSTPRRAYSGRMA